MELYRENFRNLPVPNHKAYGYQILHVALSIGPSPRDVNYNPRVELIAKGYKFYIGLYSEILRNFLVAKNKNYGYQFYFIISVYLSSLPVAHLSDAPRRRLVVTGDSARIQDETTENSAWFFNVLGV